MLNIRTRIRTDLNISKRIRSRIRSENIRTVFIPTYSAPGYMVRASTAYRTTLLLHTANRSDLAVLVQPGKALVSSSRPCPFRKPLVSATADVHGQRAYPNTKHQRPPMNPADDAAQQRATRRVFVAMASLCYVLLYPPITALQSR